MRMSRTSKGEYIKLFGEITEDEKCWMSAAVKDMSLLTIEELDESHPHLDVLPSPDSTSLYAHAPRFLESIPEDEEEHPDLEMILSTTSTMTSSTSILTLTSSETSAPSSRSTSPYSLESIPEECPLDFPQPTFSMQQEKISAARISAPVPTTSNEPSPPTKILTPTTPPTSPQPKPTLLSLPPELLLQILSHIPTSSSLHTLSQTSRYLFTFIHIHAPTITKSLILSKHAHAAHILGARHTESSMGFLVPSHELVLREERRRERDVVVRCGCKCFDCKMMLKEGQGTGSIHSLGSSAWSSVEEVGFLRSCLGLSVHTPTRRIDKEEERECKARKHIDDMLRLTTPGPQFLVFLERYGWEVSVQWDAMTYSIGSQYHAGDGASDTADEAETAEREREEKRKAFVFMVGNYCVRRFLEDAEREIGRHADVGAPTIELTTPVPLLMSTASSHNRSQSNFSKLKAKFLGLGGCCGRKKSQGRLFGEVEEPPRPARTKSTAPRKMFGEIVADASDSNVRSERDNLVKGLLWYHSPLTTRLAPGHWNSSVEGINEDLVTGSSDHPKSSDTIRGVAEDSKFQRKPLEDLRNRFNEFHKSIESFRQRLSRMGRKSMLPPSASSKSEILDDGVVG